MNHDILITTIPGRAEEVLRIQLDLRNALLGCRGKHRVTVICDGALTEKMYDNLITTGIHRLVVHKDPQGLAFSISEWAMYLRLTEHYYGGASERTSQEMSFTPEVCTMLQDDVELNHDMFPWLEKNHEEVFRAANWFSGYDAKEHKRQGTINVGGVPLVARDMGCAVNLTAMYRTWMRLTPIPKTFGPQRVSKGGNDYGPDVERGNPSRTPRLGSRVEHWLQGDSPNSGPLRTVIYPGGVTHKGESTWNR